MGAYSCCDDFIVGILLHTDTHTHTTHPHSHTHTHNLECSLIVSRYIHRIDLAPNVSRQLFGHILDGLAEVSGGTMETTRSSEVAAEPQPPSPPPSPSPSPKTCGGTRLHSSETVEMPVDYHRPKTSATFLDGDGDRGGDGGDGHGDGDGDDDGTCGSTRTVDAVLP